MPAVKPTAAKPKAVKPKIKHWMLYALGGGIGHLNRSVALARAILRHAANEQLPSIAPESRTHISLLTNSPFANDLPIDQELQTVSGNNSCQVTALPAELSRDELAARIKMLMQASAIDVLVVDTFARGLGGELVDLLPQLRCRKILVHRNLNPRYVEKYDLATAIDQYDCLLIPGESAPFENAVHATSTAPWLIRDDHELLPLPEARIILRVESETLPVVAVIGCGKHEEVNEMCNHARQLAKDFNSVATIRFVAPRQPERVETESLSDLTTICLWPLLQAMRAVSVLVGSGGYNTVHEAKATATPFIGIPRKRLYDLQYPRLEGHSIAMNYEDIRRYVADAIEAANNTAKTLPTPRYSNGVHEAIQVIEAIKN